MEETTLNPQSIAQAVAYEVAENPDDVGDFVQAIDLGENVTDFRFVCLLRGYEGWQWAVTLYHDPELGSWSVDESSLVPTTGQSLLAPPWVPWKDRLKPEDLAVVDTIGTDPDDPRIELGLDQGKVSGPAGVDRRGISDESAGEATDGQAGAAGSAIADHGNASHAAPPVETTAGNGPEESSEDLHRAVLDFKLTRRHVLSPLGRSQTAQRWYEGPRGPKSLSTKTAAGSVCSTCGFFVPLKGELNLMFGVCANKWSPDDGRVVSLDHGCGEHSEIAPPDPSPLWVQSKPAYDDLHIDVVVQAPREERDQVELIEELQRHPRQHDDDLHVESADNTGVDDGTAVGESDDDEDHGDQRD